LHAHSAEHAFMRHALMQQAPKSKGAHRAPCMDCASARLIVI
jgi:hypothetical protein